MIRVAALAIVLSLSAAPAMGVACGVLCSGNASSAVHHPGCHDGQSGRAGARIAGVHHCDHLTPANLFLLRASQSRPTMQAAAAEPGLLRVSLEQPFAVDGGSLLRPTGGGVVLHSRSPILRI